MSELSGSVGAGGAGNAKDDVAEVQRLLNLRAAALGIGRLRTDGVFDPDTKRALGSYAARVLGKSITDKLGPGHPVLAALADTAPSTLMRESARGREAQGRMSGAGWAERAAAFADSRDPADLSPLFAVRAGRFLDALTRAGAQVRVEATRRDPVRAWLIRNARAVADGSVAPGDVPPEPRAPVIWDHGELDRSRTAAAEMAKRLGSEQPLPEGSPHFDGHVISMAVRASGPLDLIDGYGATHRLDQLHDGVLHAIGESYGVFKHAAPSDWGVTEA